MKKARPYLIAIPLLLLMGSVLFVMTHPNAQEADARYHAGIPRSIRLTSEAFADNGAIPALYSCSGEAISPPLAWTDLPEGTRSLVLLATDQDIPTANLKLLEFVHWVLYDIPADAPALEAGVSETAFDASGIAVGPNGYGKPGYYPPCPPFGSHAYVFRLYALDVDTLAPEADDKVAVLKAMEGHILAYGELTGFYQQ
ncbi:MAG: YbhB/YbcL family Raf kinase inhibitor-like protein [Anaerolineae bacterium]|jgi:Raf kinase inhibitor-like YbhB/YbcL family protein|nr:YbhB/YbcL family Raf kinase inhibitor-like protein [Anaerolineae bacterium]